MSDDRRNELVEELFIRAVELREGGAAPEQIDELLRERCNGDASLRAEVESLLNAHVADAGVLDRADIVLAGTISQTAGGTRRHGRPPWQEPTLPPGSVLGGYTIQRVLGSGGMGVVYVAQQDRPRRTVALKVIRPAMTSPAMLKRFEAEAEILGRLHHPGIAQIYEAGLSEGRPFLAMELVDGASLIEHAERRGLNTRERLELAARVCDAVQHAHQKGVIHRDLKPSNILVDGGAASTPAVDTAAEFSHVGQPKVLDFGVARATDSDMQVSTLRTTVGQLIGTLPYMSPEQVAGDQNEVDTRSDVYALGVILYQLLAGKLPHDVSSRSIPEAARVIRDEHPSRLSAVSRVFRGDIETIVSKAMDKDRQRRYQSAAELRDDLRRHLAGEPIAAKRDSALYLLRTQLRRYRGAVAAAAAFVVLLIVFSVYAASQAATNARLARSLAIELSASNIERGRALTLAGNASVGEGILWREFAGSPDSLQARWALWEHYLNRPIRRSIRENGFHSTLVVFSADGTTSAVRGMTGDVQIWDGDFSKLRRTVTARGGNVLAVALAPDASALITGDSGGNIEAWDVESGERIDTLRGTSSIPQCVVFAPDGTRIYGGFTDGTLAVWDWPSRVFQRAWRAHPGAVWDIAVSDDSRQVATGGREAVAVVWSAAKLARQAAFRTDSPEVRSVAFAAGSRLLIAAGSNSTVELFTVEDGQRTGTLRSAIPTVHSIALDSDQSTLLVAGSGGIEAWDLPSLSLLRTLTRGDGAEHRVSLNPVTDLIASSGSTGRLLLWDSAPQLCASTICEDHGAWVVGLNLSSDGTRLITSDLSHRVRLWEMPAAKQLAIRTDFSGPARAPMISPDGSLVAMGLGEGVINICSMEDLSTVRSLRHETRSQVCAIAWSPDGRSLVSGTVDGDAAVWDVATGKQRGVIRKPAEGSTPGAPAARIEGRVLSAAWSGDGRFIALTATNPTLSVWEASTLEPLLTVPGQYPTWSVAFSPDSTQMAAAMSNRVLALFDTSTWEQRASLEGHSRPALTVAYSPDGKLLASSSADGTVRLWDPTFYPDRRGEGTLGAGRRLVTISTGDLEVSRVVFSTNSRGLYTAGADRRVVAWDLGYYDRHIAGNMKLNLERVLAGISPRPDTSKLEAWAAAVLAAEQPPARKPPPAASAR